jgi:hypothetical protein
MSFQTEKIQYALAKQVQDMERGFTIHTNYGDIFVDQDEGKAIITATRNLLERKLKRAQEREAAGAGSKLKFGGAQ